MGVVCVNSYFCPPCPRVVVPTCRRNFRIIFIYKKPKGKLPVGVTWNDEYRLLMLELITDDGKAYPYSPFWCGYFETLHKAEIVEADNDLVYKPDGF